MEAKILDDSSYSEFSGKGKCLPFGDGSSKSKEVIANTNVSYADITPSVSGMVKEASELFENQKFEDVAYFEPYYLKDFVAGKK